MSPSSRKSKTVRPEAYDANGMLSKSNTGRGEKKTRVKIGRIRTDGRTHVVAFPAGVALAPLCQTFGNGRRSIYYFCRKNEKKVRRGDSRGLSTGSRRRGAVPRGLFAMVFRFFCGAEDFSVAGGPFFTPQKNQKNRSGVFGERQTLE